MPPRLRKPDGSSSRALSSTPMAWGRRRGPQGSPSDAEVGAALLVRPPALLGRVPAARLVLPAGLFPLAGADSLLPEPSVGRPLPPPVRRLGPSVEGALSSPVGRPPRLHESLQRPPPPAGRPLSAPLRREVSPPLMSLPPLQSVVSAPCPFPPFFGRPPLLPVHHHPLGLPLVPLLRRPLCPPAWHVVVGFRSPIPSVMLIGMSAKLSAAF